MSQHDDSSGADIPDSTFAQPIDPDRWSAAVAAMKLTPQLARVVELVMQGLTNKQIATAMDLSVDTVKDYLKRISTRTGTQGRYQLMLYVVSISDDVLRSETSD